MAENNAPGRAEQREPGHTCSEQAQSTAPAKVGQPTRLRRVFNFKTRASLPPLATRGKWPTLPTNDVTGVLSRLRSGPLRVPVEQRYFCTPSCAGCGHRTYAAATGFYQLWQDERPTLVRAVHFEVCIACFSVARGGGVEADALHEHLMALGRWAAAGKRLGRFVRCTGRTATP